MVTEAPRESEHREGATGERDAPAALCPNCGEPLAGRFCSRCGQDQRADRSVRALLAGFIDDALDVDARLWRSLRLLLTRPGFLTAEHAAGRRVRYLPPVRLYLIGSVVFFTMIALAPEGVVRVGNTEMTPAEGRPAPPSAAASEPSAPPGGLAERPEPAAADATASSVEADGWWEERWDRAAEDPERLEDMFLGSFAWVMFVLVPIFALLLAVLWRGSGLLYVQHLVFALHYHAFAFLTQAAGLGLVHLGGAISIGAVLSPHGANALYLFLAARRFYGDGSIRTLAKVALLGSVYILVISAGMLATLFGLVLFL